MQQMFLLQILLLCFGHHYAHHQELKSIIPWLLPVVFGAVVFKLLVWCGAEGYVSGLQDACWFTCKGIRTHNLIRGSAVDLHLRRRGH